MANGYDDHSLTATGLTEASSSSLPLTAVRDKRFTKTGIGFRTETAYAGGTASRKRGAVDESDRPWETAQTATSPQIRPRDTLPAHGGGVRENGDWYGEDCDTGFPDEEDARDALATLSQFADPSLVKSIQTAVVKQFGDPDATSADGPEDSGFMGEASKAKSKEHDASDFAFGRKYLIDTPEHARAALKRVKIFGSAEDQKKVKAAVQKKYPDMKIA
jgi:hypothetical protein